MNISLLDSAIKKVCPIHGVNSDKEISFKDEATNAQKILAKKIADEWDFDASPTASELIAIASESVRSALQTEIDTKAMDLGFSGGNALMLYAGFNNAFQTFAQGFAQWEASVWVEAGSYKAEVLAGTKPMLTPTEAIAMMPTLVLPA